MRASSAFPGLLGVLVSSASLAGCDDSLERLNAVRAVVDPSVDDTAPDAPFEAGQRRDVADADAYLQAGIQTRLRGITMPGDLDGDGLDDLLIWGERLSPIDTVECSMGCPAFSRLEILVFYGDPALGAGGTLVPDAVIESWHINSLRYSVDAAGDVDADGRDDVLVGIGTFGCEQGSAFVVRGGARLSGTHDVRDLGALLREGGSCTLFGEVAGLGDVDGDGHDDYAIGAPQTSIGGSERGRLYLYYGDAAPPPERRSEADASASFVDGSAASTVHFGLARRAGDVDGDGLDDFLAHARVEGESFWWLVRGSAVRFDGEAEIAEVAVRLVAADVSGIGDVDGDGLDDLGATVLSGTRDAFILHGRAEWPAELDVRSGTAWIDRVAELPDGARFHPTRTVGAGDVDGDGRADLLYGDPYYVAAGESVPRGAVYLFSGPLAADAGGLSLARATAFLGQDWRGLVDDRERGFDELGHSIGVGSDLNGDGFADLVLAALYAPDGGRVYLWLGRGPA